MYTPQGRRSKQVGEDDYYGLLGLHFGASQNEVVTAYRALARRFHPDKIHSQDAKSKSEAEEHFRQINRAYEVLSDPNKRKIYNEFGVDGLKYEGWVLERKELTVEELRDQFRKFQKNIIDNKLAIDAKPYASFTMGLDASSLFAKHTCDDCDDETSNDEDLKEQTLYSLLLPNIEISSMAADVKVDNEFYQNHTITLNGSLNAKNGTGDGNFGSVYSYKYSSATLFHLNSFFGNKPLFSVGFQHQLSKKTSAGVRADILVHPYSIIPGMELSLNHKIRNDLTGKVVYKEGIGTSVRTSLIYINEALMFQVTMSYKIALLYQRASIGFDYDFNDKNSHLSIALSADLDKGLTVAYGCRTRVLDINVIGATLSFSIPSGVTLNLSYRRANQEFNLPIYLSDEVTSGPLFYGTVAPLIAYVVIDRCYLKFIKPNDKIFANI